MITLFVLLVCYLLAVRTTVNSAAGMTIVEFDYDATKRDVITVWGWLVRLMLNLKAFYEWGYEKVAPSTRKTLT